MGLSLPTTQEICDCLVEELEPIGGTISDRVEYGDRLFLRSLVPFQGEVRPKDIVQGGIAVTADEMEIRVHPYLFRQVCRNGAVMPQLAECQTTQRVGFHASTESIDAAVADLREAVRACSRPAVFADAAKKFSMTALHDVTAPVFQLLLFSSFSRSARSAIQPEIMRRFMAGSDRSLFSMVNAVTSVARDQTDPEARWRLEELGGGMMAMEIPRVGPGGSAADLGRHLHFEDEATDLGADEILAGAGR